MEIILALVGIIIGIIVTHRYYKKSRQDAKYDRLSQRMEWADSAHKVFLVAILNYGGSVNMYALLNWSGRMRNGYEVRTASNGCIMYKSIKYGDQRIVSSTRVNNAPAKDILFSLTERGIESTRYLKEKEVDWANFELVDVSNSEALFNHYGYPPK